MGTKQTTKGEDLASVQLAAAGRRDEQSIERSSLRFSAPCLEVGLSEKMKARSNAQEGKCLPIGIRNRGRKRRKGEREEETAASERERGKD